MERKKEKRLEPDSILVGVSNDQMGEREEVGRKERETIVGTIVAIIF